MHFFLWLLRCRLLALGFDVGECLCVLAALIVSIFRELIPILLNWFAAWIGEIFLELINKFLVFGIPCVASLIWWFTRVCRSCWLLFLQSGWHYSKKKKKKTKTPCVYFLVFSFCSCLKLHLTLWNSCDIHLLREVDADGYWGGLGLLINDKMPYINNGHISSVHKALLCI